MVWEDAQERGGVLGVLLSALRARQRDVPEVSKLYRDVRLLVAARSQEWIEVSRGL